MGHLLALLCSRRLKIPPAGSIDWGTMGTLTAGRSEGTLSVGLNQEWPSSPGAFNEFH